MRIPTKSHEFWRTTGAGLGAAMAVAALAAVLPGTFNSLAATLIAAIMVGVIVTGAALVLERKMRS